KAFAWLAGISVGVGIYNLAYSASGQRWPGALALGLLALDPALATGRVSGSEAPLVAALSIFVALAAIGGRADLLPWLLAALVLARPDGAWIAGVALVVLLFARLWHGGELSRDAGGELRAFGWLARPSLVALGVWGLYGLVAVGTPLPALWNDASTVPGARALGGLWGGYLALHPTF